MGSDSRAGDTSIAGELLSPLREPRKPNVVWAPLPGSQALAMSCPANIIFYHGTRGPGKTDAQLMRFMKNVGRGYGAFWRGVIFDHEYKNLDDIVAKSLRWFHRFQNGARFLQSKSDYKWVWPTGEELLFRAVKHPNDYWLYHGQEFPWIGWNELTKYATPELYDALMSCNRTSFRPEDYPITQSGEVIQIKPITLEVFSTGNPFGPGHHWVKKRFIDAAPSGKIVRREVEVFSPALQDVTVVTTTSVQIFGSYIENIFLPPGYIAHLTSIKDPNRRKAWLAGSWDITSGGMFDDIWATEIHVISPFQVPSSWKIYRSFDWGSSKPFSVGWWAVSDGSDLDLDTGQTISTVPGDLFRIFEWYGCEKDKPNTGLRLLPVDVAKGIVERELEWGIHHLVLPGPADSSIWDGSGGVSIANQMALDVTVNRKKRPGVIWTKANKAPGSRINGWNLIRKRLMAAIIDPLAETFLPREEPALFVTPGCVAFITTFPTLPRDEKNLDDVDTNCEDHVADEVRYMVLSIPRQISGKTKG